MAAMAVQRFHSAGAPRLIKYSPAAVWPAGRQSSSDTRRQPTRLLLPGGVNYDITCPDIIPIPDYSPMNTGGKNRQTVPAEDGRFLSPSGCGRSGPGGLPVGLACPGAGGEDPTGPDGLQNHTVESPHTTITPHTILHMKHR
ncbi:hypothetical protein AAFF_G00015270 [Aldrovandia affinis]|uniref:Uncharacterized protein n=1 Tax=Aldrovandia affinis TaxID=143900 RepID=A0AAD7WHX3_9TELE|nr:hypothetical protein AAFF_G00015270 [Aldrovandia affinis]